MATAAALLLAASIAGCAEEPRAPLKMAPGMTPPVLVSGKVPEYTPEALAQKVEGPVAAECVITEEGAVTRCRIVRSLPPMDQAVLNALATWRCNPARLEGAPVAVEHVFTLRLALPRPPGSAPPPGVIPFHEGMTRPTLIVGRDPVYTKEALENRIQGHFKAKCVVSREGEVTNCIVEKSLPLMDQPILDALMSRRYTPATFNGVPVSVTYTFNVKVVLPRRPIPD
jgi:TonB family protein